MHGLLDCNAHQNAICCIELMFYSLCKMTEEQFLCHIMKKLFWLKITHWHLFQSQDVLQDDAFLGPTASHFCAKAKIGRQLSQFPN